ncbi:MAG: amidohydrolase family protein [Burkholderiales bacterium]|nr:amidohydrolase family protein [Burkholderiales bacterium]
MDLVLQNARLDHGRPADPIDVGIANGKIALVAPHIDSGSPALDLDGRLLSPGLVETHVHLDKSRIMDRCRSEEGTLAEAIREVAQAKRAFTVEDVYRRASRTLEAAIVHGVTHLRTHVEVDPSIGTRGLEAMLQLKGDYAWAVDLELVAFPQEGLISNPGTDALILEAMDRGARVVGGAPYVDSDPHGQIDRVFEIARRYDADVDLHLDFFLDPERMDVEYVCRMTDRHQYAGRVNVGHVSALSTLDPEALDRLARRIAGAGVAVTVLPSTDLFLMGSGATHNVPRGTAPAHRLVERGVNCSLSTNNVLNPFTPFGDSSLLRMANLYANIAQLGRARELAECFEMITRRSARILGLERHMVELGAAADLVILDAPDRASAVAELATPLYGFKRGRMTFRREPARLLRPEA